MSSCYVSRLNYWLAARRSVRAKRSKRRAAGRGGRCQAWKASSSTRCLRIAADTGGEGGACSVPIACLMMCHYYGLEVSFRASAASLLNSIVT